MKFFLLFLSLVSISLNAIEGFAPDTLLLVPDENGIAAIGSLNIDDFVFCPIPGSIFAAGSVKKMARLSSPTIVQITIQSVTIMCGPDQLFYSPNARYFVPASTLNPGDLLLTIDNQLLTINNIQTVATPTDLVAIHVTSPNTLAVSRFGIIAHNFAPAIIIAPALLTSTATTTMAIGTAVASSAFVAWKGISGLLAWCKNKSSSRHKAHADLYDPQMSCGTSKQSSFEYESSCGYYAPNSNVERLLPATCYPDVYEPVVSTCNYSKTRQNDRLNSIETPLLDNFAPDNFLDQPKKASALIHQQAKNNNHKKPKGFNKPEEKVPEQKPEKKPGPHGIYDGESAKYHSKKDNPWKSRRPTNGQAALDNSVPVENDDSDRRIGISCGEFVVLGHTGNNIYHGHVRSWDDLEDEMQDALINNGMTTKKGKIIGTSKNV